MSLEISLTSRAELPPGSIRHASPPPATGGFAGGHAPTSANPAAVYTPGRAPSNAGAYFRPASVSPAERHPSEPAQQQAEEPLPT